jgi:hypothetical protein
VFVPGADAEGLNAEDLDAYIEVVKRWPLAGPAAWCAVKWSENPWRDDAPTEWWAEYREALAGIPALLGKPA